MTHMETLIEQVKSLRLLSDQELRKLRRVDPMVDKFLSELYKLIDLDKVRDKAVRKTSRSKRPKIRPHRIGKKCYVCHVRKPITKEDICDECKDITAQYLLSDLSLHGKLCIVTGGRIKIGYHIALWLLRRGGTVIVTTRFPLDSASRYEREEDYTEWSHRLYIREVDFRSSLMIEEFCNWVQSKWNTLYLLVNNAAQTIKRPEYYYRDLVDRTGRLEASKSIALASNQSLSMLAQRYDIDANPADFPDNIVDIDGQQLDLRTTNSWTQSLPDINILECVETQLINSIAPFYIIQKLTGMLKASMPSTKLFASHIINITSQEGRFQKDKGSTHPHNNMSKAALNMLTKTIAKEYKSFRCQVVSVDTGWANSMIGPTVMGILSSYEDCVARVIQPLVDEKDYSGTQLRHFKDVGFNEPT